MMISSRSGRIVLTSLALTTVRHGLRPALLHLRPFGFDRVDLAVGPGAETLDHVALPVEPARPNTWTRNVCVLRCDGRRIRMACLPIGV